MKMQEWLDEYRRLVADMMAKVARAESYGKTVNPERLEGDEQFAKIQDEVTVAARNLEELWKKLHSGSVTLD